MMKNWAVKRLGEVCEVVNGGTPDTKVAKFWDGEHLWITPKDMGKLDDIYVDDTERKITVAGLKNSSAKIIPINSIILSKLYVQLLFPVLLRELEGNQEQSLFNNIILCMFCRLIIVTPAGVFSLPHRTVHLVSKARP